MEKLPMCRICLVQNVRMFVVINRDLHELYEKLTDIPFVTEDRRPILACFFCCAKLKQCYQLLRKCLDAEELFAQMMNEDYKDNSLIKQGKLEFCSGFIKSPTENISIVDECQTESIVIKEELPAVCEGLDDIIEPKEEHESDELELENLDNSCLEDEADIPPHHSETDLEDDMPLMEFKTESEEELEVSKKKQTARETNKRDSDSAVSSMGSERVPSLSDGEWCDGSDSDQEFHSSKFRPYDNSFGRERAGPHQAQKKNHVFGKRCFQSNIPSPAPPRFAYATPDHTYSAPLADADQRPAAVRDKRVRRLTDGSISDGGSSATSSGQHLSRDEKRAKALGIPLEVHDIIKLPMYKFNERLSKHDLSKAQLSLIGDIRRRGKNKVAAQNCRKRKLDQITSLADEVRTVRDRKIRTQRDHSSLIAERQRVKERFAALYCHVFLNLRDPEGRPLSFQQYSLQQAADGNVVLVPKMPQHQDHPMTRTNDDELDRKSKSYDQ